MSPALYILSMGVLFGTILLIFAMRYFSAVQQAKARMANGEAYRQIAEKAVAVQSDTASSLAAIRPALADVAARLTAIESILKAVE